MYGRPVRWAHEMIEDNEDPGLAGLRQIYREAWPATQARRTAGMITIGVDVSGKLKKAAVRRDPTVMDDPGIGTRMYFYSPHPVKNRRRRDGLGWRGPATVRATKSLVSCDAWQTKLLDQLRLATMKETTAIE